MAKKGEGVKKSETRRENAETEYHRLLCEESMQEVGNTAALRLTCFYWSAGERVYYTRAYLLFPLRFIFSQWCCGRLVVSGQKIGQPAEHASNTIHPTHLQLPFVDAGGVDALSTFRLVLFYWVVLFVPSYLFLVSQVRPPFRVFFFYHVKQAGLKLLKDRRLEVALKNVGKLGQELDRLTELLEELGGQVGWRRTIFFFFVCLPAGPFLSKCLQWGHKTVVGQLIMTALHRATALFNV